MTSTGDLSDPGSLSILQRRLDAAARRRQQPVRRMQVTVAQVVVAQMLPASALKGGAGLKLRLGNTFTRDSSDLDTAVHGDLDEFARALAANLAAGWNGFTATVTAGEPATPAGVPPAYVMRPFAVKIAYRRRSFMTLDLEVGYDELDVLGGALETHLADDVQELFAELGLQAPAPVALLPTDLQIAQKLHACSSPGSDRAHDLVDLQLLAPLTEDTSAARACHRLFSFRRAHAFPPTITATDDWEPLYAEARQGLDVLPDARQAVAWANAYVDRLATSLDLAAEVPRRLP